MRTHGEMSEPTQQAETTPPTEPPISRRATSIARGLIATGRAIGVLSLEYGMLRLRCRNSGNYWIKIDGGRVFRGKTFLKAEELQPKFIDAMERGGR
jgi:hypothetical protein